jgi:sterol desaturase/sphingolipid hydroxylase (fatty acid hydroxylase superfamily)
VTSLLDGVTTETLFRLGAFSGVLLFMMIWEINQPRRSTVVPRIRRWTSNLGVSVINRVALLIFPILGVSVAGVSNAWGWGLFNSGLSSSGSGPDWIAIVCSVVLLDLAVYFQHRLFHVVPWFWRLHRMHHADVEFDVTTGVRFHPLEAIVSMVIKLAVVACLGAPMLAVLIFEIVLSSTSLFNHSNVKLPIRIDAILRRIVVTPDMHRVHHSTDPSELNHNFGFNLPWWDRLFRTYQDQPAKGHDNMTIGLEVFRSLDDGRLDNMLVQPFVDR